MKFLVAFLKISIEILADKFGSTENTMLLLKAKN